MTTKRERSGWRHRLLVQQVALGAVLAIAGPSVAGKGARQVEKAESLVEIRDEGARGRTLNRTFEAVVGERGKILLRKEMEQKFDLEYGQGPPRTRIDAWKLPRAPADKPLYTITDRADVIEWFFHPLLMAMKSHACCESMGSRTVFNVWTGKTVLRANGQERDDSYLAMVFGGTSGDRLFGVADENGGYNPSVFPGHRKGYLSIEVTAADLESCLNRLRFDLPVPETHTWVSSVSWQDLKAGTVVGLQVRLALKESLSGSLKIEISDKRKIIVPVSEAGLNAAHVVMPPNTQMSPLTPCL